MAPDVLLTQPDIKKNVEPEMNGETIFKFNLNKIQVITYFPKPRHTFNGIYQSEEFFIEHTFIPYLDSFANILTYFIYIHISLHLSSHGFVFLFCFVSDTFQSNLQVSEHFLSNT